MTTDEAKGKEKLAYCEPRVLASYDKEDLEKAIQPQVLGGGGCGTGCGCGG